ncbi:hypothetical protein E4K67_22560 [Desulfosporosinus fructosivorans]|uniref:Phage ABA sandwich domain-containing protein n=1 Tax=Desulfosporosinus fructosivorans TaxID=2018669 RepID=A0A4Z0QYP0_9FIRM|nr:hypothetical protein [Desulfosporosinus fructosivorans]TGE35902.1 hypothetical protein E4K67_22560 [Desulfosporosinus fructosivorans]
MTRDEILAMVPGRELDALVAEKVFGWTGRKTVYRWDDRKKHERPLIIFTDGDRKNADNYTPYVDNNGTKINYSEPHKVFIPPCYSTDISVAWDVVEKMCKGRSYEISSSFQDEYDVGDVGWLITWGNMGSPGQEEIWAPTIPEAICKAALLAKEDTSDAG